MRLIEILGRDGRKRIVDLDDPTNAPMQSGNTMRVPMMLCDTAGDMFLRDEASDAVTDAEVARREMIDALTGACRHSSVPRSLHDGEDTAEQAYRDFCDYTRNAWRGAR